MPDHYRIECSCGTVLAQCRCISEHTRVEVRHAVCEACQAKLSQVIGVIENMNSQKIIGPNPFPCCGGEYGFHTKTCAAQKTHQAPGAMHESHDLQLQDPESLEYLHANWDHRLPGEVRLWVNGGKYRLTQDEVQRLSNWLHLIMEEPLWQKA